jgi:hypothetical protein
MNCMHRAFHSRRTGWNIEKLSRAAGALDALLTLPYSDRGPTDAVLSICKPIGALVEWGCTPGEHGPPGSMCPARQRKCRHKTRHGDQPGHIVSSFE